MSFNSVESIIKMCKKENIHFAQAILKDDLEERGVDEKDSKDKMKLLWQAMLEATASYDKESSSASGLVGKEGGLMEEYRSHQDGFCFDGNF